MQLYLSSEEIARLSPVMRRYETWMRIMAVIAILKSSDNDGDKMVAKMLSAIAADYYPDFQAVTAERGF